MIHVSAQCGLQIVDVHRSHARLDGGHIDRSLSELDGVIAPVLCDGDVAMTVSLSFRGSCAGQDSGHPHGAPHLPTIPYG